MDYKKYNFKHEEGYYYSPFSPQRKKLRADWNNSDEVDWDKYLYENEIAKSGKLMRTRK